MLKRLKLPYPDNSIQYFQAIKDLSESYWTNKELRKDIYGFQIQKNSKWNKCLSENQILEFENEVRMTFPSSLKNFYKVMNGLDKKGINIYGHDGNAPAFRPVFYSYPDDLQEIKEVTKWVLESNNVSNEAIESGAVPKIFPIMGHRFMVLDDNLTILSMYGSDIIPWAENISKLIAMEIFEGIENGMEFDNQEEQIRISKIRFWLE